MNASLVCPTARDTAAPERPRSPASGCYLLHLNPGEKFDGLNVFGPAFEEGSMTKVELSANPDVSGRCVHFELSWLLPIGARILPGLPRQGSLELIR